MLLYANHSLKKLNKTINCDLSNLVQWPRANKISLKVNKTELIIFRSPKKQICKNMNFQLSGQEIEPKHHSLSMNIVMSFDEYMNTLKQKLNRGNGISAKLRHYVSADILKTIYYALFDSYMRYACQIWGQSHSKTFDMIQSTQNIALRNISFKQSMEPSEPLNQNKKK